MKIVLDTNILLVSISPNSSYYWVFQKFLSQEFILCLTTDILLEYEEIIINHMGKQAANTVLQIIENSSNVELIVKKFNWNLILADPDDNKFVDCAIAANAKYLVTQDKHFNVLKNTPFPKVEVIDIVKFKELFSKS